MRNYELAGILLLGLSMDSASAQAATKLLLHEATSPLGTKSVGGAGYGCANGTNDFIYRTATTTQGSSSVTKTFAPTATAPPCQFQTASGGGQYLMWVSPPISAAVTISGNIDFQAYCSESNPSTSIGLRFIVQRWNHRVGGVDATVMTSANTTECSTAMGVRTIAAAAPTSTGFSAGDRIVLILEMVNTGTWGGNSTKTGSVRYDGNSGATGDTFVNFVDTITFGADSNNSRVIVQ